MSLLTSLQTFGHFVHDETTSLFAKVPENVKAIFRGKIAEANLTFTSWSGVEKRQWVVEELAKITGASEGILHGLVHLLVEESKALLPDVLKPYEGPIGTVVEKTADKLVDKSVEAMAAKLADKVPLPPTTPSPVAASVAAPVETPPPAPPTAGEPPASPQA